MFTGIVIAVGTVEHITGAVDDGTDRIVRIATPFATDDIDVGASVACAGVCLTVIETGDHWFEVQISNETLSRSTLGSWTTGSAINLERALRIGDELGGHIVSGHVDGIGEIISITEDEGSRRLCVRAPEDLSRMIAAKGSITIEGVSLTVNEVEGREFGVNIIPHTLAATTLGHLEAGSRVNLEVDMLARYVARLLGQE